LIQSDCRVAASEHSTIGNIDAAHVQSSNNRARNVCAFRRRLTAVMIEAALLPDQPGEEIDRQIIFCPCRRDRITDARDIGLDAQASDTPQASGVLALKCGQAPKVSTSSQESCKNPSHELVQRRRTFRFSRLSPWQSERGLDPRRAGIDRAE